MSYIFLYSGSILQVTITVTKKRTLRLLYVFLYTSFGYMIAVVPSPFFAIISLPGIVTLP